MTLEEKKAVIREMIDALPDGATVLEVIEMLMVVNVYVSDASGVPLSVIHGASVDGKKRATGWMAEEK